MSNRVNLTLDVTKTGIQNPLIKVRQGDGGFETLRTTVTSNGEPLDLQGWTITFMGTTAGDHKIVDGNVTLVEAPNGIFDYTPSKAWGMDIGEFKIAYFNFVKGDGSASSANFRVNVIEAVDLTQEEAQNYISVVDATITEVREHLESSLADVTQSIAATSSAAGSLSVQVSGAVNQVNSATSSAVSVASSAANNVNSVASSAVGYISSNSAELVHKDGTETIPGDKTFTGKVTFSGAVNAGFIDKLIDWETPVELLIPMAGPFSGASFRGHVLYQGSTISFNFGGEIGSAANMGASDITIGQLPSGAPLPLSTIRGFIVNVSTQAPVGAIRINTNGSITMNLAASYTSSATNEYWEMSASGYTKAVFAPLSNASYQNIVEFSPENAAQGAAFTKDYYFAMAVNSTEAGLVVYNRNTNVSQIILFGNGPSNTGFTGHANDLAVLLDNSNSGGDIWLGASHMYNPGMPVISYNPASGVVTKQGNVTFTTDEENPKNLVVSTIVRVDMATSKIVVSASGKYWSGYFDKDKLAVNQNVSVTEIGTAMITQSEYSALVGETMANMLSVGQADWLEGDEFYKVKTSSASKTISIVVEFTISNKTAYSTGRYWMVNHPDWANNEIEKTWVENGVLYANVNRNTGLTSSNIIAKLADL